jgi:hypothetical protein
MFNGLSGILILAGIVLIVGSRSALALPLFNLGMAAIGGGVVAMGLQAILSGEISMRRSRHSRARRTYVGLGARLYGVLFILMGLVIIGVGLLRQLQIENAATAFLASLVRTPQGISLSALVLGGVLILIGLINLADLVQSVASRRGSLMDLPARLVSFLVALPGLVLIAFGAAYYLAPQLVAEAYDTVLGLMNAAQP